MTNSERVKKLEEAYLLLSEVEQSYDLESFERKAIYEDKLNTFSFGKIGALVDELKNLIKVGVE